MASNDEELFFGADDEPVKDETDNSSVEDAAASDKASAEGGEAKSKETEPEVKAEAGNADDEDDDDEDASADSSEATNELEARYMNLYAEYDNYRRRTQKEKDNLYADAVACVTKEFLTLIDNLDRATEGAKKADEDSLDKVIQGMELVGRQAQDTLKKIGVEEIPAERGNSIPTFTMR